MNDERHDLPETDDASDGLDSIGERPKTRREFLVESSAAWAVLVAAQYAGFEWPAEAVEGATLVATPPQQGGPTVEVRLRVNGAPILLAVDTRETLLDALRERLALTGTKKGCDRGQCGACTVLADGQRVNSCLALAVAYEGSEITTIEGLASPGGELHPLQAAFVKHDGFQCGYCTPGQIMSAAGLLAEGCPPGMGVRECMSGNICRCGAYPGIVAAVEEVRAATRAGGGEKR